MDYEDKHGFVLGDNFDEYGGFEYTIPDGFEAEIKDSKVIVRKKNSKDERIREQIEQALIEHDWSATYKVSKDDCLAYLEKQKEPHFTKRNALFDECVAKCDPAIMKKVSDKVDEMLGKEQKPAEWSKEDERNLYNTIEAIKYAYDVSEGSSGSCLIAWLKFHLRPQPHWKPSEEQMKALLSKLPVVEGGGDKVQDILESLYDDLQKLM